MTERPMRRAQHVVRTIGGTPLVAIRRDIFQPPTDVYETDSDIIVKVDIAGVEEGNMEVTIEEGLLRVHGYRSDCSAFSKSAVHRMEIMCGEFETIVHLPHAVDTEADLDSVYRSGMLTIVLPKQIAHKVQIIAE